MRKRKYYIPGKLKNDDVDNENLSVGCNSLKFELCVFQKIVYILLYVAKLKII